MALTQRLVLHRLVVTAFWSTLQGATVFHVFVVSGVRTSAPNSLDARILPFPLSLARLVISSISGL